MALRQQVGDEQVMADQYLQLMFNAHIVRVVPADVLVNSAGILLWEYDKAMPVAYSETDLTQVFVQDRGAIARTRLVFDRLAEVALESGSPGEFHPWAPTDPGVTVSRHRALVTLVT
ncbi:Scr1 family TA system antitoxin-like transcriptional regulator, partial [Lentzea aerocolonigenes]|uniref:Scr1 family TA system antitoxin-like transcriptional regulator n=1 Tax=Lentzea aerocolonigenes TaxID=68170 RepID=UPI0031F9A3CD